MSNLFILGIILKLTSLGKSNSYDVVLVDALVFLKAILGWEISIIFILYILLMSRILFIKLMS